MAGGRWSPGGARRERDGPHCPDCEPADRPDSGLAADGTDVEAGGTMLVHSVFFWLKPDLTEAQRADFRRGVDSLVGIKSAEKVYVGIPAKTAKRPVVDDSYSVALTVVCRDVAAHDAYQVDPLHLKFVEQFKTFWTRVQIYDAQ